MASIKYRPATVDDLFAVYPKAGKGPRVKGKPKVGLDAAVRGRVERSAPKPKPGRGPRRIVIRRKA